MISRRLAPNGQRLFQADCWEESDFIPGLVWTYCTSYMLLLSGFDVLFILKTIPLFPSETKVS